MIFPYIAWIKVLDRLNEYFSYCFYSFGICDYSQFWNLIVMAGDMCSWASASWCWYRLQEFDFSPFLIISHQTSRTVRLDHLSCKYRIITSILFFFIIINSLVILVLSWHMRSMVGHFGINDPSIILASNKRRKEKTKTKTTLKSPYHT